MAVPVEYEEAQPPSRARAPATDAVTRLARGQSGGGFSVSRSASSLPVPLRRRLRPDPAAVSEARGALTALEPSLTREGFHTLRLLVTELVSNSVRHGCSDRSNEIDLVVRASPHKLRVVVEDSGVGFAASDRPSRGAGESGWGLHLVERLSRRWGVERDGTTRVWFELEGVAVSRAV